MVPAFLYRAKILKVDPVFNSERSLAFFDRTKLVAELDSRRPKVFHKGYSLGPGVVVRSETSGNIRKWSLSSLIIL